MTMWTSAKIYRAFCKKYSYDEGECEMCLDMIAYAPRSSYPNPRTDEDDHIRTYLCHDCYLGDSSWPSLPEVEDASLMIRGAHRAITSHHWWNLLNRALDRDDFAGMDTVLACPALAGRADEWKWMLFCFRIPGHFAQCKRLHEREKFDMTRPFYKPMQTLMGWILFCDDGLDTRPIIQFLIQNGYEYHTLAKDGTRVVGRDMAVDDLIYEKWWDYRGDDRSFAVLRMLKALDYPFHRHDLQRIANDNHLAISPRGRGLGWLIDFGIPLRPIQWVLIYHIWMLLNCDDIVAAGLLSFFTKV